MRPVNAALAQFERSLISERTREGLAHARSKGSKPGPKPKISDVQARNIEAMLRDRDGYPFITDVIRDSGIARSTFYDRYPRKRIEQFRPKKEAK
ncbi:MAG: recombinase family protein [Pseudomonadota bacterium]